MTIFFKGFVAIPFLLLYTLLYFQIICNCLNQENKNIYCSFVSYTKTKQDNNEKQTIEKNMVDTIWYINTGEYDTAFKKIWKSLQKILLSEKK